MNFPINLLRPSKKTVLTILIVSLSTLLLSGTISLWLSRTTNLEIPSIGKIKTIGIEAYWDEYLKNKTEIINWGINYVGSSKNVTLYLQSTSNVETDLNLNTTNWNPKNISKYMYLFWNYNGTSINSGEIIQVKITLSNHPSMNFIEYIITNDVKEFSFDIVIKASELYPNP